MKIRLERIDIQEEVLIKTLLDSNATGFIMSLEFARKQRFELKKIKRLIYVRNIDSILSKERLIEHTVKVNI